MNGENVIINLNFMPQKFVHQRTGIRTDKKTVYDAKKKEKVETERKVIVTKFVEVKKLCKSCGKGERQDGSSRCKKCADRNRLQQSNKTRLQHKIDNNLKK